MSAGLLASLIVLVVAASQLVQIGFDPWLTGVSDPYFDEWGLAATLANVAASLAAAVLAGVIVGRASLGLAAYGYVMPAAALVWPLYTSLAYMAALGYVDGDGAARIEPLLYWIALAAIAWTMLLAYRRISGRSWIRSSLATLVVLGVSVGAANVMPGGAVVYFMSGDIASATEPEDMPVDVEGLYYAQEEMMEEALAGLTPERPGRTDLFAVMVAGYASERVFLREAEAAGRILEDRYGMPNRTVRLVNSSHDPERYPLANLPNLRRALTGIAAQMNRAEDVLFLYMTSHGSEGVLSTRFWPVRVNPLTAGEVAAAVLDAGIDNAVIVVSACKSGSFIPYMDRPNYLVMTASAADRNSFGCSDAAEWTWFGRALFEFALPRSAGLVEAFESARTKIAADEADAGYDPSMPQIHIGKHTAAFLERLSAEIAGNGG